MAERYLEPQYDTTVGHAAPWQDVCPVCQHRLVRGFVACGLRGHPDREPPTSCSCTEAAADEIELPDLAVESRR